MPEADLLTLFVGPLEALDIRYMVSGSVADSRRSGARSRANRPERYPTATSGSASLTPG
jgi:hypothetical protein